VVTQNFINAVAAADLNGDGIDEALAGGRDWRFRVYDANLQELFGPNCDPPAWHGVTAIRCADVDGDGLQEIFVANRYGSVNGFRVNRALTQAEYIFHRYLSIGDVVCDVGDLDGDGKGEVVLGVSTGDLAAARPDKDFERMLFRFDNFGYDVTKVHIEDVNRDGAGEVLVASKTGYVYVLDGRANGEGDHEDTKGREGAKHEGAKARSERERHGVRSLLAYPVGRAVFDVGVVEENDGRRSILAGDANGQVVVVSLSGQELFRAQAPGSVFHVAAVPLAGGRPLIVAATSEGDVVAYRR
jgi:hypothetical protein